MTKIQLRLMIAAAALLFISLGYLAARPFFETQVEWTIAGTIVDELTGQLVSGDVYINNALFARGVREFTYKANSREVTIRVEATGYLVWDVTATYKKELPDALFEIAVKLKPIQ